MTPTEVRDAIAYYVAVRGRQSRLNRQPLTSDTLAGEIETLSVEQLQGWVKLRDEHVERAVAKGMKEGKMSVTHTSDGQLLYNVLVPKGIYPAKVIDFGKVEGKMRVYAYTVYLLANGVTVRKYGFYQNDCIPGDDVLLSVHVDEYKGVYKNSVSTVGLGDYFERGD